MSEYIRHPNIECIICKRPVYKRPLEIEKNKGRVFCSMACYGLSCRKEIPCVVCGKLILGGLNKKTCSRHCSNKHRQGIKYKIYSQRDKVKSYRSLKVRLLKARGNKCEKCGYKRIEILQVHHINSDRNDNILTNLELVCPNCHFEKHYLDRSWFKNYKQINDE